MYDVLNDLKKVPLESDDTEHLISEEIHWLVKFSESSLVTFRKTRFKETDSSL